MTTLQHTDPRGTPAVTSLVRPRSRRHVDRSGDPLDGLVNLFDLGIVLSVAFLLAALSSLHLSGAITRHGLKASLGTPILINKSQQVAPLPPPGKKVIGHGVQVGVVYKLTNGELVYVQQAPTTSTSGSKGGSSTSPGSSTISPGSTTISPGRTTPGQTSTPGSSAAGSSTTSTTSTKPGALSTVTTPSR